MPGLFGFYPFVEGRENWKAARFLYYGLSALQGRGQESVSVAIQASKDKKISIWNKKGFVDDIFLNEELKNSDGYLGIGQTSPDEEFGLTRIERPIELILAGDGKPLGEDSRVKAFQRLAQRLSVNMEACKDSMEAVLNTISEVKGGYTLVALTARQQMICARSKLAVKPLEVGSVGFDLGLVGSESCALDVVGANHTGRINPGEVVIFDPLSIERKRVESARPAHCAFEYVYLARPDSTIDGTQVGKVRDNIGRLLAEESPAQADAVIGVPETAVPFAMAYSETTKIPVKQGFIRTGRGVRSAIRPTQFERLSGVQLKLNPVKSSVEGNDIVLVDDSIVRGNTLKSTVMNLKRKGARQVHVRIGSPAIISHCPYGTEIPPRDELIGRALSKEEIAEIIGADSFSYLSVDALVKSIGLGKEDLCLGCFLNKYPEE